MELDYILINQKNEEFYLSKMKANVLLDKLDFHFRQPYTSDKTEMLNIQKYLNDIEKQGIDIACDEEGIQRRLQVTRIKQISKYLQSANSFFPNCVILSVNVEDEDYDNLFQFKNGQPKLVLPENVSFQIIDGQHRLAGLYTTNDDVKNNFDVPIVLFINITKNLSAKIFIDVNGNQKSVNSSVIYDLYDLTPESPEFEIDKQLHLICKKMNEETISPLYRHIKMLGIGRGAISQAFLIDALKKCYIEAGIDYKETQYMFSNIVYYLKSFQMVFPEQWPVLDSFESNEKFWEHSNTVLKINKSQMLKTNGLGGILKAFPSIYKSLGKNPTFEQYFNLIKQLENKIDWVKDDMFTQGTGAKNQDKVKIKILKSLNIRY